MIASRAISHPFYPKPLFACRFLLILISQIRSRVLISKELDLEQDKSTDSMALDAHSNATASRLGVL